MSKLEKQIYYCDVYSLLDDIVYIQSNSFDEIVSDNDYEELCKVAGNKEKLQQLYNHHCINCPVRHNCAVLESIHCDEDDYTFDEQVEIYHDHAKELYEDAWRKYLEYED